MANIRIDIWNMALMRIGENDQLVEEETEDRPAAEACNIFWEDVLKRVIEAHHWSFCKKQAVIAQDSSAEREGWDYVYALPTDCITPLALLDEDVRMGLQTKDDRIPYEVVLGDDDTLFLCCDYDDDEFEVLEYIARNEYVPHYSGGFVSALAWLLASELALALTKDMGRSKECYQLYEYTVSEAAAQDKNRQEEDVEQETPSVAARGG